MIIPCLRFVWQFVQCANFGIRKEVWLLYNISPFELSGMTCVNGPCFDTTSHHMLGFVLRKENIVDFSGSPFKKGLKMSMSFKDYFLLGQPMLEMITPDCSQKWDATLFITLLVLFPVIKATNAKMLNSY